MKCVCVCVCERERDILYRVCVMKIERGRESVCERASVCERD